MSAKQACTNVGGLSTVESNVRPVVEAAMEAGEGVLRLAPCWVPRSFLQPGRRLKLHPDDLYAFGLERGGIDERWFGSTTEAANEGRTHDEGLSYIVHGTNRVLLKNAIHELGATIVGEAIWQKYKRWPVYSKFFDNMGPIPLHMHQSDEQAALVGQEGKPEAYYFPPQHNNVGNNFPYTFFGLTPGTTKDDIRSCIANWAKGDNRINDYSAAYQLRVGSGWLIGPGILHAPGSFCTYEPQWGSDVFGMYQNLVEGRAVPRSLLVKDMPPEKHNDFDFIVDQLDWEANVDPAFKSNHYLEPVVDEQVEMTDSIGTCVDRWIVYGRINGKQYFTAKELTLAPGASCTICDKGASGALIVQGEGRVNGLRISSPKLIRFHDLTADEVFISDEAARAGVRWENTSDIEQVVVLRYFGPEVYSGVPGAPEVGAMASRS